VSSVAELYEPVADEQGLDLSVEAPAPLNVHGLRELFSQALSNLIDNAIKYSAPDAVGERRTVHLSVTRAGDMARLVVADQGPGIPEADRPRVLDRFVRLDTSRSLPGSGLGLSLVAAVVQLHGGTMVLEDNEPGLRIIIDIPLETDVLTEAAG